MEWFHHILLMKLQWDSAFKKPLFENEKPGTNSAALPLFIFGQFMLSKVTLNKICVFSGRVSKTKIVELMDADVL